MKFGAELKLKKEWKYNSFLTFEKGDTFKVAQYEHNYGMKLHHPKITDLLNFGFNWMNRADRIDEYFEVVESFDDRLAELEKVILDYYLNKGYKVGVGDWNFTLVINSYYKNKNLYVQFYDKEKFLHYIEAKFLDKPTTKEMFDKAIEYFAVKNNKQYVIYQADRFTPAQRIANFDNKNKAEKELERMQNESCKVDEFTCFYIDEEYENHEKQTDKG